MVVPDLVSSNKGEFDISRSLPLGWNETFDTETLAASLMEPAEFIPQWNRLNWRLLMILLG